MPTPLQAPLLPGSAERFQVASLAGTRHAPHRAPGPWQSCCLHQQDGWGGGGGAEISCRRPRKGACVWGDLEHAEWAALTLGLVQAWPLLTSCCFCPEL